MFRTKLEKNKTFTGRLADFLTGYFGSIWFLIFHFIFFPSWLIINAGLIPNLKPFDPFPYGLLTTIVSLEAIFLSIIVLISQKRSNEIDELREEIDLQINIQAENEVTKIINMLDKIHNHLGLSSADDKELAIMKERTNLNRIQNELLRINKKK
ncbi:MAG TPA: DUF1003 domain-containing protein [Candidatus Udaeobacter sp.]|nr:DUF1003 domain-containing protein [Candidatus Udaeobacter sp.]